MTVRASSISIPVRIPGLPRLGWLPTAIGVGALLGAALLGVLVGPAHISVGTVIQALLGSILV